MLTGRNSRTNADHCIRTAVEVSTTSPTAAGEVRYYRLIRAMQGKVALRTYGRPGLEVVLVQSAPATSDYKADRKRSLYVNGAKQ